VTSAISLVTRLVFAGSTHSSTTYAGKTAAPTSTTFSGILLLPSQSKRRLRSLLISSTSSWALTSLLQSGVRKSEPRVMLLVLFVLPPTHCQMTTSLPSPKNLRLCRLSPQPSCLVNVLICLTNVSASRPIKLKVHRRRILILLSQSLLFERAPPIAVLARRGLNDLSSDDLFSVKDF
jgi:hypothetical protein